MNRTLMRGSAISIFTLQKNWNNQVHKHYVLPIATTIVIPKVSANKIIDIKSNIALAIHRYGNTPSYFNCLYQKDFRSKNRS